MAKCLYAAFLYGVSFIMVGCSLSKHGSSGRKRYDALQQRMDTLEDAIEKMVDQNHSVSLNTSIEVCPEEFYKHRATNACYRIVPETKTWFDARKSCAAFGADLIWIESKMEYRHIVIKLLGDITASKDNYVGYWTGANDIVDEKMYFWGDSDVPVMSTFFPSANMPTLCRSYCSYRSRQPSSSTAEELQKHCVGLTYVRATMRMSQEESECDGKKRFICKCKTKGDNPSALCGRD